MTKKDKEIERRKQIIEMCKYKEILTFIHFSLDSELIKKKYQSRTISERKQTLTTQYPTGMSLSVCTE